MPVVALLFAVLHASPSAPARGADGSVRRPFPTLAAALAVARDGEKIVLGAGIFAESVTVKRAVMIIGQAQGLTILEPPEGAAITVQGASGVTLRDLTVRGGSVGVQFLGGYSHAVSRVHFSGQWFGGVALVDAEVEIALCSFENVGRSKRAGRDSFGVHARGGSLWVAESTFVRAGWRSIRFNGAFGGAHGNTISGAGQTAIAVSDGARVTATGNQISRSGGASVYAFEARLEARGNEIDGGEYGLLAGRGSYLLAVANSARNNRTGIAFVAARGMAVGNEIFRGGISLTDVQQVEIRENSIYAPGAAGIHMVGGRADIGRNDIAGALLDGDGDFGTGIHLERAEATVEGNLILRNAGAGMVFSNSLALAENNDVRENGGDGAMVRSQADVRLLGNDFNENRGHGVAIADQGAAALTGNRLSGNSGRAVDSRCREDVRVALSGNETAGNVRGPGGGCD